MNRFYDQRLVSDFDYQSKNKKLGKFENGFYVLGFTGNFFKKFFFQNLFQVYLKVR
jgi:hypothetical protein